MSELTIAIPTYNRSASLRRLLDCLAGQTSIDRVDILVSDNGSTDGTQAVLTTFKGRLNLRTVGFDDNRGFDANYFNCIEHATGTYVWVMGDDDLLTAGAVSKVLASIGQGEPALIICNGGDHQAKGLVPRIRGGAQSLVDFDDVMMRFGWHLCWIGTSIVRRDLVRTDLIQPRDHNAFIHLPLMIRSLRRRPITGVFVEDILLHTTVNNSDYFRKPETLIRTFGSQLFDTLSCLGNTTKSRSVRRQIVQAFHKHLSMFDLKYFLRLRVAGQFPLSLFLRNILFLYRLNGWFPLFVITYIVPVAFVRQASRTFKRQS